MLFKRDKKQEDRINRILNVTCNNVKSMRKGKYKPEKFDSANLSITILIGLSQVCKFLADEITLVVNKVNLTDKLTLREQILLMIETNKVYVLKVQEEFDKGQIDIETFGKMCNELFTLSVFKPVETYRKVINNEV